MGIIIGTISIDAQKGPPGGRAKKIMLIRFWGVRGSIPTPLGKEAITKKIIASLTGAKGVDLDDPEAIREYVESLPLCTRGTLGGNTACVDVQTNEHHIILDAGSGLRNLGNSLLAGPLGRGQGTAHFFISHTHWDHIQGFPYFVPAYIPGNRFYIYSPKEDIREKFINQQIEQDLHPVRLDDMGSKIEFVQLDCEGIDLGGVKVSCIALHHPGGSYAYRIEENDKILVYASDAEYKSLTTEALQPYLDFFNNADALIFDAMYTFSESVAKEGWGHSTSLVGVDMAARTGVKRLILFHHEPNYDDEKLEEIVERTASYYSLIRERGHLEILLAVEGLEIEI